MNCFTYQQPTIPRDCWRVTVLRVLRVGHDDVMPQDSLNQIINLFAFVLDAALGVDKDYGIHDATPLLAPQGLFILMVQRGVDYASTSCPAAIFSQMSAAQLYRMASGRLPMSIILS